MWTVDQNVYHLPQIPGPLWNAYATQMFLLGLKLAHQMPPLACGGFQLQFFFSLKQNLMQILCSLTSAISILADICENGVKKTAKTWKHMHL